MRQKQQAAESKIKDLKLLTLNINIKVIHNFVNPENNTPTNMEAWGFFS